MNCLPVKCTNCGKTFWRPLGRVNEGIKKNWRTFCSRKCLGNFRNKQKPLTCANPKCNKKFSRQPHEIPPSNNCFCSSSCAAIVNNSKFPKRKPKPKVCPICGNQFFGERKYCSKKCWPRLKKPGKKQIISEIKKFYKKNGRIPLKREYYYYHVVRSRFGTWNKAIETAGFEPNPVLFAKKYIANDGHKCDSLAEKIIDDFLFAKKIKHKINVPYPKNPSLTADFIVGSIWIEFFGLNGELKSYDRLKRKKLRIVKNSNLNLIAIYPQDLFPKFRLERKLNFLIKADSL